MKKLLLTLVVLTVLTGAIAQTKTPGPAETKLTNALCDCLNKVDDSKIVDEATAKKAFMDCFMQQIDLAPDVAQERGIDISDQPAMRKLGVDVGVYLLKQKCAGFMKIAAKMAESNSSSEATAGTVNTFGVLKRIETKGFNYIIIADADGREKSFLWLKQFSGSEKFEGPTAALIGKKVKVVSQDIEVYLPAAKGYYKVKEITAVDIL